MFCGDICQMETPQRYNSMQAMYAMYCTTNHQCDTMYIASMHQIMKMKFARMKNDPRRIQETNSPVLMPQMYCRLPNVSLARIRPQTIAKHPNQTVSCKPLRRQCKMKASSHYLSSRLENPNRTKTVKDQETKCGSTTDGEI